MQIEEDVAVTDKDIISRKAEIDKIVKQMNDLSELFREISTMVIEQGTLLDRIDFNVSDAARHVSAGNRELQKIMDAENNRTAKYVLWCEVQLIVVCLVILLLKYSH